MSNIVDDKAARKKAVYVWVGSRQRVRKVHIAISITKPVESRNEQVNRESRISKARSLARCTYRSRKVRVITRLRRTNNFRDERVVKGK